jgi:hypothetical protein
MFLPGLKQEQASTKPPISNALFRRNNSGLLKKTSATDYRISRLLAVDRANRVIRGVLTMKAAMNNRRESLGFSAGHYLWLMLPGGNGRFQAPTHAIVAPVRDTRCTGMRLFINIKTTRTRRFQ